MRTRSTFTGRCVTWVFALSLVAFLPRAATCDPRDLRDLRDLRGLQDPRDLRAPRDPLIPLLQRMNRYFHRHEIDGVTLDSRYPINPSEAIRMSVVSQLLGYIEMYKAQPTRRFRRDIVRHADYLIGRLDLITSGTPFDGMLGYSLLGAYAETQDSKYLDQGTIIVNELKAIPTYQCILNGGLMVAMTMAEYYRLTSDVEAEHKARDILSLLPPYQHSDGSFPHWCPGSRDIHYTGWMAMELIHLQRTMSDPRIEPILARMRGFIEGRVDSTGRTHYEEPCPGVPGCMNYYDSQRTGCAYDYDTRAWTVEPGYSAELFDHFRSPSYRPVMNYLHSLENGGTFSDKWDYIPPPSDPEYPWSIADTSVANMSIIFWSLATIFSGRTDRSPGPYAWLDDDEGEGELGEVPERVPAAARLASPNRAPRWTNVDSLFIAGVDPWTCCNDEAGVGPIVGRGERLGCGKLAPGNIDSGAGRTVSASSGGLRLEAIRPTPARDDCPVRFTMPSSAKVSLAIYDASGREVRELVSGSLEAGEHEARWDRRDAAGRASRSGLYFARLRVGEEIRTARILLIR